ncbi:MAG: Gfo/Idh/MocA family protein, partial [Boseongicola sp.]
MSEHFASESTSGPLRVAAIGLGWVTQNRHLPVMARQKSIEVVGVIDRHPGRAAQVADRLKLPRHAEATSLRDVPWIDEVDAITIGTAPFSHFALISEALELGKHVLTEKPFTMSRNESDELITRRDAAGRTLAIVHNFQFASSTSKLLADLSRGRLGEVASIQAVQFG